MNNNKQKIINHYEESLRWVKSLGNVTEEQWRRQIGKGKWTVAEVIGHLIPWDEFVLNKRIRFFFKQTDLPKGPQVHEVNNRAAIESQKRSKEETIEYFVRMRKQLIEEIQQVADELWLEELIIGTTTLTLFDYFSGLVQHDEHHFQQIKAVV
ncbi:DinB family protein [Ornithinibacillus sp. L9]|uniref:DinB family protein n=1 Tax=Ornithinibacillus caprae TaxID=2678566 RepID=A0A6N8FE92_9BACI|nr:DinB family protein [Ornithinibacillus caprae]MUK87992.1 DinB family protein [Ornithinibacillus caprae]